jgi:hypothetical protein
VTICTAGLLVAVMVVADRPVAVMWYLLAALLTALASAAWIDERARANGVMLGWDGILVRAQAEER